MPRSSRISSAAGVVGPFAASQIMWARTRGRVLGADHLLERGGPRTSHSSSISSSFVASLRAGEAVEHAVLRLVRDRGRHVDAVLVDDRPLRVGERDHGRASSARSRARLRPTLPKPWIATRVSGKRRPSFWSAVRMQ